MPVDGYQFSRQCMVVSVINLYYNLEPIRANRIIKRSYAFCPITASNSIFCSVEKRKL